MLSQEIKDIIKQAFSNIKQNMPDFVVRFAQNAMIADASKTLGGSNDHHIICIEAPTGIGKTLSYLLSGIPIAKSCDKKLIISTATVALQEQLVNKDLPDVQKYSQLDFSFSLIKGRGRYVCIRNLTHQAQGSQQEALFKQNDAIDTGQLNKKQTAQLVRLERQYKNQAWDGESDTLENPLEPQVWSKIQCNHSNCGAKQCDYYENCCFFNARKHIFSSDVLIANHDLVLADLLAGNTALPAPNEALYIFDEAHHLPRKALNHFANQLSLSTLDNELKNHTQLVEHLSKMQSNIKALKDFKIAIGSLIETKNNLTNYLNNYSFQDSIYLFNLGIIDPAYRELIEQLYGFHKPLLKIIEQLSEQFEVDKKQQSLDNFIIESIQTQLSLGLSYYQNALNCLDNILSPNIENKPPIGRWVEQKPLNNHKVDYVLHSAKIDISTDLKQLLWDDCAGAVLTSATLSSLGHFSRLNNQLGLDETSSHYLRLPSPFDCSHVKFTIAKLNSLPNDERYNEEVSEALLKRLDPQAGSLVLFTSYSQMQAITGLIEDRLKTCLLCQGEYSKQAILDKHKTLRDDGLGSIIFGLDSFYEGVDLPKHYLTHVLIIKLRFNVPNSPLEKTTQDYFSAKGQNSFYQTSLPDASLKLIQACGRLIRSETDTGQITIFDRRLVTKSYGKQLLSALPDFQIIVE